MEIERLQSFYFACKRVDFHSRRFAFRGAGGEPPQAPLCGVSPIPLIPQESARLPFQSTEIIKFV